MCADVLGMGWHTDHSEIKAAFGLFLSVCVSDMRRFMLTLCAVWSAGGVRVVCRVRLWSGCVGGWGPPGESMGKSFWRGLLACLRPPAGELQAQHPVGPYSCRRRPFI